MGLFTPNPSKLEERENWAKLIKLLSHKNKDIARTAKQALERSIKKAEASLLAAIETGNQETRCCAIEVLADNFVIQGLPDSSKEVIFSKLLELLNDPDPWVAWIASSHLWMNRKQAGEAIAAHTDIILDRMREMKNGKLVAYCGKILAGLEVFDAVPLLLKALTEFSDFIDRKCACEALCEFKDPKSRQYLFSHALQPLAALALQGSAGDIMNISGRNAAEAITKIGEDLPPEAARETAKVCDYILGKTSDSILFTIIADSKVHYNYGDKNILKRIKK